MLTLLERTVNRVSQRQRGPQSPLWADHVRKRWAGLCQHASDMLRFLSNSPARESVGLVPVGESAASIACPDCGQYFANISHMRRHCSQKHGKQVVPSPPPANSQLREQYMQHAVDGLPQCRHCGWQFSSWHWFLQHFDKQRCPQLQDTQQTQIPEADTQHQSTTSPQPEPNHPPAAEAEPQHNPVPEALRGVDSELVQLAQGQDWKLLAQNIRRGDQHYCPFCNQWLARPTYLSRHLRTQHAVIYKFHDRVLSWLTERSSALSSPCAYCHVDFKASHTSKLRHAKACTTLYRTGLLRLIAKSAFQAVTPGDHERPSAERGPAEGVGQCGGAGRPHALNDGAIPAVRGVGSGGPGPGEPEEQPGTDDGSNGRHGPRGQEGQPQRGGGADPRPRGQGSPEVAPRRQERGLFMEMAGPATTKAWATKPTRRRIAGRKRPGRRTPEVCRRSKRASLPLRTPSCASCAA